jgi:UTP-glucose-1-phosphate uridylyltransferase
LTHGIFETLNEFREGLRGEIQHADVIKIHSQKGSAEIIRLNERRFDCMKVNGYYEAFEFCYKRYKKIENNIKKRKVAQE